jgi:putative transposase
MPRRPRVFIAGLSLHVYQRGHNRSVIFDCEEDYEHFLWLARDATSRNRVNVHGYGLMTNHYHLIVTPHSDSSLPAAMKELDGAYTRYYNRHRSRTGTLWGGRYHARLIEDERYWWTALRYVEANPVEAHIVSKPEDYRWSSYGFHAAGQASDWLVPHDLYLGLGATAAARQTAYRALWCQTPR